MTNRALRGLAAFQGSSDLFLRIKESRVSSRAPAIVCCSTHRREGENFKRDVNFPKERRANIPEAPEVIRFGPDMVAVLGLARNTPTASQAG